MTFLELEIYVTQYKVTLCNSLLRTHVLASNYLAK